MSRFHWTNLHKVGAAVVHPVSDKTEDRFEEGVFCPKCGSANVNFSVFYRPPIWKCPDCGYEGPLIIEDRNLAEKIRVLPQKRMSGGRAHFSSTSKEGSVAREGESRALHDSSLYSTVKVSACSSQ